MEFDQTRARNISRKWILNFEISRAIRALLSRDREGTFCR